MEPLTGRSDALASLLADMVAVEHAVPWPCPSEFGPGGRYRLEEVIGAGRESVVYRAVDLKLSSDGFQSMVAIKAMRSAAAPAREAQAIRRVVHPNVVVALDAGSTEDGFAYVVSDFVDGGDLSQAALPMDRAKAVAMMIRLCRAVQAVHSAGLVHCDLKPANVLLTREGEPKLVDFELARWATQQDVQPRGNIAFMSPEQFVGEPDALSPPTDIYALGGLLFHLLTGKMPAGNTREQIAEFHAERRAAPDPGHGTVLGAICRRAMARDRAQRYNSAGEMADDLERWQRHEPPPWLALSSTRRMAMWARRRPVTATLVLVGAAGVALGVATWHRETIRERDRLIAIERDARMLLDSKFNAAADKMVEHVRMVYRATFLMEKAGGTAFLPTAMLWMHWASALPTPSDRTALIEVEPRLEVLRNILKDEPSMVSTLGGLLTRLAIAQSLVELGRGREAIEELDALEPIWVQRIGADDPSSKSLGILRECAQAWIAAERPSERDAIVLALSSRIDQVPIGRQFDTARNALIWTRNRIEQMTGPERPK